ncbi:MAG: hypothetical protein ACODAC_05565 [Pseudomonadota bacterium]
MHVLRRLAVALGSGLLLLGGCGEQAVEPEIPSANVRVLAQGAGISGANGLHFGPEGLLYVASVMDSELLVMDPDSGEVRQRLTARDGVVGPDDVAFSPEGAFYWTSILTGEVAGFTVEGERVVAGNVGAGANPLTFSDDGRLFVAQCFLGDGLFELDPEGRESPRIVADDLGPGCGLNGMDWGPDGRLYGPRWFRGEVVSYDVDSGERRLEADGFEVPAAVKFDHEGRLHVLDSGAGEVVRLASGERRTVVRLAPGLDNLAFGPDGRLFVSSFTDGFVVRVDGDGTVTELSPGGMAHPGGVAVVPGAGGEAQVMVGDLHALRGFDPDSGEARYVARNIIGVGELGGVGSVAADGEHLIVTGFNADDVRVWDPRENVVVARYPDLSAPVSAIRYQGSVVVAEHGEQRVVSLGGDGETVLARDLPAPTGLATDGDRLWVSDRERGEVLEIARSGDAMTPVVVADGLKAPEGIAVVDDGIVVVEGESGRVLHLTPAGGKSLLAVVSPGSPPVSEAQPPSGVFNDVAAMGDALFVSGESHRVLYRIDRGASASAVQ